MEHYDCCKGCSLKSDHPGISLDSEGVCNLCRLDIPDTIADNFNYSNRNFRIFSDSVPAQNSPYDCLFMYSGGKDSTFMLDRFVNEEKRRVLAYTFDVPFQSEHAMENIKEIKEKIKINYFIDADHDKIRQLMRHVFNHAPARKPGKYLDEKTPCMLCRDFFILRAIVYAYKEHIPFIIFCADPQQIMTIQSRIKCIIKAFYQRVGRQLTTELFGEDLEVMLFSDEEALPKIVFPFIAMRHTYKPEKMIEELKGKGLYTSSPLETHCTLFPLLNYYSFKHYDCSFYRLNMASQARGHKSKFDQKAETFGIKFTSDHAGMAATEARYKNVIFDIIANQENAETQKEDLRRVFKAMAFNDDAANYLIDKYMNIHNIASELGIDMLVEENNS